MKKEEKQFKKENRVSQVHPTSSVISRSIEFRKTPFADKYGVYDNITQVHSDIKSDITKDFILAKLKNNDAPTPEPIIELVRDAYFAKKEIEKLAKGWRYEVDSKGRYIRNPDKTFKRFSLTEEEQLYIMSLGRITFNSYMIKLIMIAIMYRNIDQNTLIELITEKNKINDENEGLKRSNEELMARVKSNIKKGGGDE